MAGVALTGRRYVRRGLRQSRAARLVAGRAIVNVNNRRVSVRVGRRRPRHRAFMARVALRRGRRVRDRLHLRVLRKIASAMAGRTLAVQSRMVHRNERERDVTGVACIALAVGWNVSCGPALRHLIVMAGRTPPDRRRVVQKLCA